MKEIRYIPYWIFFVLGFTVVASAIIITCLIVSKKKTVKSMTWQREEAESTLKNKFNEELETVKKNYDKQIEYNKSVADQFKEDLKFLADAILDYCDNQQINVESFTGAPDGDWLDASGLPESSDAGDSYKYGSKYTFYVYGDKKIHSEHSAIFHSKNCHYALTPINALTVKEKKYTPCLRCMPELPDMEWVPRSNKLISILRCYTTFI